MEEFNKDLQKELSEAYPNADYMNVLNSTKRNLVRNDCGIVITGRSLNILLRVIYDLRIYSSGFVNDDKRSTFYACIKQFTSETIA